MSVEYARVVTRRRTPPSRTNVGSAEAEDTGSSSVATHPRGQHLQCFFADEMADDEQCTVSSCPDPTTHSRSAHAATTAARADTNARAHRKSVPCAIPGRTSTSQTSCTREGTA